MNQAEEVTELVGMCLWDTFSDNHEVIMADGRCADIGSFRGASAFLDEYLTRGHEGWCEGDYMRFSMGSIFVSGRADLTSVYTMIFRRLQAAGADWIYHFPELGAFAARTTRHAARRFGRCQSAKFPYKVAAVSEKAAPHICASRVRLQDADHMSTKPRPVPI